MKNLTLVLVVSILGIFFSGSLAFGGGFLVYTHDAAATGMGLAYTAQADRPSAVFYNPAAINQLEGTNISAGGSLIIPRTTYRSPTGSETEMDHHTYFLPNFFVTHKINDKFAAGFGVFCPFGLSTDWPSDWEGRYISTLAEIRTLFLNPVISWQVHPRLSLAVGFNSVLSDVELRSAVDLSAFGLPDGESDLDGDGSGQGFNLGLLFQVTDDVTFGVSYRSPVDVDYNGQATFDPLAGLFFPNGNVSIDIDLPAILAVGLSTTYIKNWTFEFDLYWVDWATMDTLLINYHNPLPPDQPIIRNWKDVFFYSLGARYQLNESIVLRGGYMFRNTPVPESTLDPLIPDADNHIVTVGAGYQRGGLSVDAAYMAVIYEDRTTNKNIRPFNGTYESSCNLIGLNLQYLF